MAINCCYGCVPPKRTPTCKFDGTCNKYAEANEKHQAEREALRKHLDARDSIYQQKQAGIRRAARSKGRR